MPADKPSGRSFLGHTLLNGAGIAAGQLLVLLAMPFLARQYSPAEFGVYASLVAVSGIIGTGASLRFDMAIPSTGDSETSTLYRIALCACAFSVVIGVVAVAAGLQQFIPWPLSLSAGYLALLAVLAGVFHGVISICNGALVRAGRFAPLALLRIAQPLGFVVLALLAVPGGLPAAYVAGLGFAGVSGLMLSWQGMPESHAPARNIARKYWEYPALSLPVAMLDTLTLSMPLLFIMQVYGEAEGGNYSQVQRLAAAPLILGAMAISQVFYKHAGDLTRAGEPARPLMWKTVRRLALAGAAVTLVVALVGEPVLALFLGKGWRTDSHYLMLILLPAVIRVCVSPITSIFLLTGQVRLGALWQVIYAGWTWSVLTIASARLGLDDLLFAVLVSELLMYALYLWMADLAVRRVERKVIPCAA